MNGSQNNLTFRDIQETFSFVGDIRRRVGLAVYPDAPRVVVVMPDMLDDIDMDGIAGSYCSVWHRIKIRHDAMDTTLWHELAHAHQREALSADEHAVYLRKTSYEYRWEEIEADATMILCALTKKYPGLELQPGDAGRIIDSSKFTRSLRLRVNKAKK